MSNLTYKEKARLLRSEAVEKLRGKSKMSTYLERAHLAAEAAELFRTLPQPLRTGNGIDYVLRRASCPVEPYDILLGRFPEAVPTEAEEAVFSRDRETLSNYGFYTPDNGHTPLDWEELIRIGIGGYAKKCAAELEKRRTDGSPEHMIRFLEGALTVYNAFSAYIDRYADAARDAGMIEAEAVCRKIASGEPENFTEAMQLVLLVTNAYSVYCVSENATLCCGRMDDYLKELYLSDLESGRLTREDAGYIIDDFNCKASIAMGRGEHQLAEENGKATGWARNPIYDSPTYVIIGGYSLKGDHRDNPLTRLFIERCDPRLENPVYVFRRTADTTEDVKRLVAEKMRQNSTILVYNDETVIKSYEFSGVDHDDAVNYAVHGCNWPDLHGVNTYRVFHAPLPPIIMSALLGEDGRPKTDFGSMDEVYAAVGNEFRRHLRAVYANVTEERLSLAMKSTLYVCDCFKRGILESAQSAQSSIKYPFIHNRLMNIASACDILAALENVVFGGKVTFEELAEALKTDFEGHDNVLRLCLGAPKFGHGDERADRHAERLMTLLTDIIKEESTDKETGAHRYFAPTTTITDMYYMEEGERLGATPDGRRAHAPLSENLSPSRGQSGAVTSLIRSVTRIPFERISSGAFNLRLTPSIVSGEVGLNVLCALMDTYFSAGGMQLQLSVTDAETLRAAQKDPDSYRDLMVRVTGYSAAFVDMDSLAQREIIARDSVG